MQFQQCHASAPMLPRSLEPRSPGLCAAPAGDPDDIYLVGQSCGAQLATLTTLVQVGADGGAPMFASTCSPASAPGMGLSHRRAVSDVPASVS